MKGACGRVGAAVVEHISQPGGGSGTLCKGFFCATPKGFEKCTRFGSPGDILPSGWRQGSEFGTCNEISTRVWNNGDIKALTVRSSAGAACPFTTPCCECCGIPSFDGMHCGSNAVCGCCYHQA